MKVSFYTLGCKVNQNETGALQQLFYENGFEIVEGAEVADVYIVNSCTVTAGGDKKSRQWLRRCKRQNPGAVTVLTGCYPQAFPEEADEITEADIITGSSARSRLVAHVQKFLQTQQRIIDIVPHTKGEAFEELPAENFVGHTRAFMKIEDGCNRHCAYCIIPKARGEVRSRAPESVLSELRRLVETGYKEVVLSGINLTCYGNDNGSSLADIVEAAAEVEGLERIRLGSIEPDLLSDETLVRLSRIRKLCCQFHLSLQSGCAKTLSAMNRLYTPSEYRSVVAHMRELFDHAVFTTDVIVGFPGETDADFEESMSFVQSLRFLKVHVFSYSRRPGTVAAEMPEQIDEQVKAQRSKAMIAAADAVRAEVIHEFEGHHEEVLLERPISKSSFTGYTKSYIPVVVAAPGYRSGDIIPVTVGEFDGQRCVATLTK
ncbi:tRNA (N(6)-L-threonylcarbamoyladenosine(37)-C(2))-methylthiotransferase MtaB [Pygmaiobacter massiliensis]|uniref:tRNA (N(6)-L-threonylcarbamoyladenosine(37)-C(2))- methylthiotransferase MtaB n=1 Tax=Pygmaiobacter massiliensis TaxID=1917873 RepID=UPI000C7A4FA8|nr:tRNA (N(6)-L-threonylcarbamoyladenosine(37)-C(2))-methylthiotransferase MtaB [Pygmaiobacter massiliensis]